MTAIFKRELKSYLTSMVGYLFIFFVLVLTGIYFSAYQLSAGYSKFECVYLQKNVNKKQISCF